MGGCEGLDDRHTHSAHTYIRIYIHNDLRLKEKNINKVLAITNIYLKEVNNSFVPSLYHSDHGAGLQLLAASTAQPVLDVREPA